MDKINDIVYLGEKKPASYTFLTPEGTEIGTSYKGLVVSDLAVLQLTALPAHKIIRQWKFKNSEEIWKWTMK
jgi:hypothetical protein